MKQSSEDWLWSRGWEPDGEEVAGGGVIRKMFKSRRTGERLAKSKAESLQWKRDREVQNVVPLDAVRSPGVSQR
jgi:hypothetical protein